jgi:menaquinone-dependent protoporphyrinogen IX oxidase
LIIYASVYGNTEKITLALGTVLQQQGEVEVVKVSDVTLDKLMGIDLLILGSPTRQFRLGAAIRDFINKMPKDILTGINVAVFDTRLTQAKIDKTPHLPFFVRIYGYAAQRMEKKLKHEGGNIFLPGDGFYVLGMKGPLVEGELEMATEWGAKLFV